MAKWTRPLADCSVGADLPRLGNKHEVRGEDGSILLASVQQEVEGTRPFESVAELFRVLSEYVISPIRSLTRSPLVLHSSVSTASCSVP